MIPQWQHALLTPVIHALSCWQHHTPQHYSSVWPTVDWACMVDYMQPGSHIRKQTQCFGQDTLTYIDSPCCCSLQGEILCGSICLRSPWFYFKYCSVFHQRFFMMSVIFWMHLFILCWQQFSHLSSVFFSCLSDFFVGSSSWIVTIIFQIN